MPATGSRAAVARSGSKRAGSETERRARLTTLERAGAPPVSLSSQGGAGRGASGFFLGSSDRKSATRCDPFRRPRPRERLNRGAKRRGELARAAIPPSVRVRAPRPLRASASRPAMKRPLSFASLVALTIVVSCGARTRRRTRRRVFRRERRRRRPRRVNEDGPPDSQRAEFSGKMSEKCRAPRS